MSVPLFDPLFSVTPSPASATDYIVSAFSKLTVGQAEQYQTRFGVIRYATDAELLVDLDTYKSTSELFDLSIVAYNDLGTNIEGAIQLATSRFMSSVHRVAARPVVIIVGNSYNAGGYNDPTQAASTFRENGGTIITIEYVQEHGLDVPILRSLASPNYNLTNKKDDGTQLRADELRDLLCEGNGVLLAISLALLLSFDII
ncbi:von Willebrand factor type A domain protein [Oesophagostomum dentatum]|uniref:von Willebrand factor type A domain protein n=1 Tax=Oesophagostomum dentatum TaxID=61180 RepID=A0A0B1T1N8_OESDE|nr:von Willebrand factor type A domain protein [Oesophagostomum dentatum]